MSAALLAPGMQHFDVPGVGFVGYMTHGDRVLALADPVAAPDDRGALLAAFLAAHPDATFVHASEPVADLLVH